MTRFFVSCLLAFTAGHMFNYTVILYLQEAVGSDLLSGIGFGLAFGSSIVFGWFAGVVCDRVPPHRIIHGAQALFLDLLRQVSPDLAAQLHAAALSKPYTVAVLP